ncbi:hypothetical protein NC652_011607 [Populus alba x Populus x berolinensis]|uniref:Uncharacterized protein n=1 Tax=Populus alba x Populus x berolinensis TaxID=444605 RepID=A0AAD6R2U0_9ROSI|nr:hypothetical protein NC652_011607 [Populus alba x Populus x berolinensis]KAJ7001305.1 hypothetical protein NC653_011666 [Populus alba x Populus x berolinensis]
MKRAYVPAGAPPGGPMGFIKLGFGEKKSTQHTSKNVFSKLMMACNGVCFLILTLLLNRYSPFPP